MKRFVLLFSLILVTSIFWGQEAVVINGKVLNDFDDTPLENVNIVNLNNVKGTTSTNEGDFAIRATVNDTIYFSYLGFKSIRVRVTNDWLKFGNTEIVMTELALALEEVTVKQLRLTGYLEVDMKQVPIQSNNRYRISGLYGRGYEAGKPNIATKVLGAIFNPADFLHNLFGKKPKEMRKLRKMKEDDEIRNLLASRFDREMLMALLQVEKVDLDLLISECNYSRDFLRTANDLQILDAISECYEEYRVLNRSSRKRL